MSNVKQDIKRGGFVYLRFSFKSLLSNVKHDEEKDVEMNYFVSNLY